MSNNLKVFLLVAAIAVLVVIAIVWPFAIIAALNTLFPLLSIPYNFWSWLSVVALQISLTTRAVIKG